MMLRLLKRPLAAFVGMWFLLVMIEPESVHSCPVHSAKIGVGQSGHAHHGATQSHHHSNDKSGAICSCPGDCAGGGFKVLPSIAAELSTATTVVRSSPNPFAGSSFLTRFDFLLPFAIGPPAVITA